MKNGQSAPIPDAISAILSVLNPNCNRLFIVVNVNAASADPPPSPAPSGMILCRCISNGGSGITLLRARYAFMTRFLSEGQSTVRPVTVSVVSGVLAGTISSMSAHGIGTITVDMLWYPSERRLIMSRPMLIFAFGKVIIGLLYGRCGLNMLRSYRKKRIFVVPKIR